MAKKLMFTKDGLEKELEQERIRVELEKKKILDQLEKELSKEEFAKFKLDAELDKRESYTISNKATNYLLVNSIFILDLFKKNASKSAINTIFKLAKYIPYNIFNRLSITINEDEYVLDKKDIYQLIGLSKQQTRVVYNELMDLNIIKLVGGEYYFNPLIFLKHDPLRCNPEEEPKIYIYKPIFDMFEGINGEENI